MSVNLAETIQINLGYPALKKIDPNTEVVKSVENKENENLLGQASIPAILISVYKYTRSEAGAENILCGDLSTKWLNEFLGDHRDQAIASVALYAGTSEANAHEGMRKVAVETVNVIRGTNPLTTNDVKNLLAAEKNNMLLYLPPSIHMGDLLNDNTVDDNTHKMEGPVSSLMNAIGNLFSESEKEERK